MALTTGFKRLLTLTSIVAVVGGGLWYADKNNYWGALEAKQVPGSNFERPNASANGLPDGVRQSSGTSEAPRPEVRRDPPAVRQEAPVAEVPQYVRPESNNPADPGRNSTSEKLKALKGL